MVNPHIHRKKPIFTVLPDRFQQKEEKIGDKILIFVIHRYVV
jgi:hypothetical protein